MLTLLSPYGEHLPIFPTISTPLAEEKVERVVERLIDRADTAFLAGLATQSQYDAWSRRLNEWADEQFHAIPRA